MKRLVVFVLAAACAGCANTGAIDEQFKKLRADLAAEMKTTEQSIRSDYARDIAAAQKAAQQDYNAKLELFHKEMGLQKEEQAKNIKEVNVSLIEIQKDFYQNRRLTEDNARRVYIVESLIAATRPAQEERAEGEILFLKDGEVTTSLGSRQGVKAGDMLAVYKDNSFQEKLATIRVMVSETTQSKGEVMEKTAAVARGNSVKPMK